MRITGTSKASSIRRQHVWTAATTSDCHLPTATACCPLPTAVYIELHAASAFSFLRGASLPETLVERAATLGYPALALVDADGVYGAPRFHRAAKQAGIRPIIGAELTIPASRPGLAPQARRAGLDAQGRHARARDSRITIHDWQLPVLVASQVGYQNLCRLVTTMKLRAAKGEGALLLEEFDGFTGGLVAI